VNAPLMRAMIAVASRCAECNSPPTPRTARAMAAECAHERQFDPSDSAALIDAATRYSEGVRTSLSSELESE
jgi:hypothetical protein